MSRRAPALATLLAGLLLIPSAAAADSNHYSVDPGYTTHVELRGTNGYRVNLYAGNRHRVTIKVRKAGVVTEYQTQGAMRGNYGAVADFPGFGRVSFQFKANGRRHHVLAAALVRRSGRRGAGGAHRGPHPLRRGGEIHQRRCQTGEGRGRNLAAAAMPVPGTRRAAARDDSGPRPSVPSARLLPSLEFIAKRYRRRLRPASRQVVFNVFTGARKHGIWIFRSARVVADNSTFAVPDPEKSPENVILRPPRRSAEPGSSSGPPNLLSPGREI